MPKWLKIPQLKHQSLTIKHRQCIEPIRDRLIAYPWHSKYQETLDTELLRRTAYQRKKLLRPCSKGISFSFSRTDVVCGARARVATQWGGALPPYRRPCLSTLQPHPPWGFLISWQPSRDGWCCFDALIGPTNPYYSSISVVSFLGRSYSDRVACIARGYPLVEAGVFRHQTYPANETLRFTDPDVDNLGYYPGWAHDTPWAQWCTSLLGNSSAMFCRAFPSFLKPTHFFPETSDAFPYPVHPKRLQ